MPTSCDVRVGSGTGDWDFYCDIENNALTDRNVLEIKLEDDKKKTHNIDSRVSSITSTTRQLFTSIKRSPSFQFFDPLVSSIQLKNENLCANIYHVLPNASQPQANLPVTRIDTTFAILEDNYSNFFRDSCVDRTQCSTIPSDTSYYDLMSLNKSARPTMVCSKNSCNQESDLQDYSKSSVGTSITLSELLSRCNLSSTSVLSAANNGSRRICASRIHQRTLQKKKFNSGKRLQSRGTISCSDMYNERNIKIK